MHGMHSAYIVLPQHRILLGLHISLEPYTVHSVLRHICNDYLTTNTLVTLDGQRGRIQVKINYICHSVALAKSVSYLSAKKMSKAEEAKAVTAIAASKWPQIVAALAGKCFVSKTNFPKFVMKIFSVCTYFIAVEIPGLL